MTLVSRCQREASNIGVYEEGETSSLNHLQQFHHREVKIVTKLMSAYESTKPNPAEKHLKAV
jgi:hypothetical protein